MYHLFKKTVPGKNGRQVRRWYYWFYDVDGKRKSRACPGCTNRADAEAYVKSLPQQCSAGNLIKDIARDMFLPGSDHVMRREKLGKQASIDSLRDFRRYILYIIELWGDVEITKLTTKMIVSTLLTIERSSSWKNRLTSILKEVYAEAAWIGTVVTVPPIPRFQKTTGRQMYWIRMSCLDSLLWTIFRPLMYLLYSFYVCFVDSASVKSVPCSTVRFQWKKNASL